MRTQLCVVEVMIPIRYEFRNNTFTKFSTIFPTCEGGVFTTVKGC